LGISGASVLLCAVLLGLFGLLQYWFVRCAAAPVDWGGVLGLKG
jgi:hypothetical protein